MAVMELWERATGMGSTALDSRKRVMVAGRFDVHLGDVFRTGGATTPLAFYVIVKVARTNIVVSILLKLLRRLRGTRLFSLEESQKGRNTRLRAISFNDLCVSRTNQPA